MSGHGHGTAAAGAPMSAWELLEVAAVLGLAAAAGGYLVAVLLARVRTPWPARRTIAWLTGLACAAVAVAGPLAAAARASFTAHTATHLLLGMVAPLLLVLGAPVTALLRALPVRGARAVSRVLRSPPVRVLTHPLAAAALVGGGLWLLYATPLLALSHASAAVHAAVHAHTLAAGYVLTAAVVGRDPDPHRASATVRTAAVVLVSATHAVLAKHLYGHPPAGVDTADARAGAQLMFYGGDAVDLVLLVLVAAGWYAAAGRRLVAAAPAAPSPQVAPSRRPYDDERAPARRHARRAARA
ncbi:cytochrome c oxidase assembly protein [Cellulomonas pakistanensis]|uniref:Cytochrome c oxidase assembly protein n=1 Tax=Cellulomonas pakistanensis TaxID=992287 RepID=A0A919PAE3_9CELL|nr:cytochrome c oxidase assembly protein [Cellulomonas pakistanensis]GIG36553.1 hypothetical protein Cpa01nite_19340 [Cellulomonas pakistanensis]